MRARMQFQCISLALLSLLAAGCSRNEYEIEMSLEDGTLQRSVTGWNVPGSSNDKFEPLPDEDVQRLEAAYGVGESFDDQGRITFAGEFSDRVPDDIGGFGTLTRFENSLGTLTVYSERLRGSDALALRWEERVQKIDRACELLADWASEHATDRAEGAEISQFINGTLNDDLENLAMHLWILFETAPLGGADEFQNQILGRFLQYAVEHGYLEPNDLPRLYHIAQNSDKDEILEFYLDALDAKRGDDAIPLSDAIPELRSVASLQASLHEFLKDTPEADEMRSRTTDRVPDYSQIPGGLIAEASNIVMLMQGGDHVSITFRMDREPFITNGQWNTDSRTVTWSVGVESYGEPPTSVLPNLCFASWAEPAHAYQEEHFGKVVFVDEPLAELILWAEGLDEDRSAEWSTFIDSIAPIDNLEQKFSRFRFSGEPRNPGDEELISNTPRSILQSAIGSAE